MANTGDYYIVTLKKSHLNWGTHRYTGTRGEVFGEGYIPIPRDYAYKYEILNSNGVCGNDELGKNIFRYRTSDGVMNGYLKAQGCNTAGDIYAKQFSVAGDLKALGSWFAHIGASEGTNIKVEWLSSSDILLSAIGTSYDRGNPCRSVEIDQQIKHCKDGKTIRADAVGISHSHGITKRRNNLARVQDKCFVDATIKQLKKNTRLIVDLEKYPRQKVAIGKKIGEEIDLGVPGITYVITAIYTED